jgi:uncharacterized membrane protein HdeD (DUF308 family)
MRGSPLVSAASTIKLHASVLLILLGLAVLFSYFALPIGVSSRIVFFIVVALFIIYIGAFNIIVTIKSKQRNPKA